MSGEACSGQRRSAEHTVSSRRRKLSSWTRRERARDSDDHSARPGNGIAATWSVNTGECINMQIDNMETIRVGSCDFRQESEFYLCQFTKYVPTRVGRLFLSQNFIIPFH